MTLIGVHLPMQLMHPNHSPVTTMYSDTCVCMYLYIIIHTLIHATYSTFICTYGSYMTLIGEHELMHPNQGHVTNLFVVDPLTIWLLHS